MNEREIRQFIIECFEKGGSTMSLSLIELKQKYPDLVAQLRKEHYAEYLAKGGTPGNLEEEAANQIANKGGVKKTKPRPTGSKTAEARAADQIAGRAGIRK